MLIAEEFSFDLLDQIPALIWRVGLDGRCVYVNQSWLAFTEKSLADELGEGWLEEVHPEDLDRVKKDRGAASASRQPYQIEYRLRHRSGEYHWLRESGRPFCDVDGSFGGLIGTGFDLTETKAMEQALHDRDLLFRGVFEYAPDATLAVDEQGRIQLVNHQAQKLLGYTPEELAGQPVEILIPANFRKQHHIQTRQYTQHPHIRPMGAGLDLFARRKDGSEFPADITLGPVQTGEGLLVMATIRDISERRQAEAELQQYRGKLEELVEARTAELEREIAQRQQAEAQMQAFASRLARSNRELQNFASIASHDLQEPLRKILAFGDRLKAGYEPELGAEGQDYLERMQSAAVRMQALLNSLLMYARVTTKAQPPAPVDLNLVVAGVLSDLEVRLDETGGKVTVDPLPVLDADESQMRQLFQNLIGNALKYQRPGVPPQVNIHAEIISAAGGQLEAHITVADNGIGFDESQAEQIFQPFLRLHGKSEYEGAGMGLAICQKIIERHQGSIRAYSIPGEGSKFLLILPMKANHA